MEDKFKRLKVVPKPAPASGILSVEDIQQWAEGHYPNDERGEKQSTAVDVHGQPVNRFYNRARLVDRAIDEMLGLCKGIMADGIVNEKEARFLADWMMINREVAECWPANILYRRLAGMLADSHLDHEEQTELLALLHEITGGGQSSEEYVANFSTSLPLTRPAPAIRFPQRHFCLTGKFIYGTRKKCEEAITAKGGTVQRQPTCETQYLVIGIVGSTDWIHSTHGRKIEAAIDFGNRGYPVSIVAEEHWVKYLRGI